MGDLIVANEKPFISFALTEFKNRRNAWFLLKQTREAEDYQARRNYY
jgi:hypothetical protein